MKRSFQVRKWLKIAGILLAAIIVLTAVAIGIVVLVIFSIGTSGPDPGSFMHQVEYTAEFRFNGTLNDTEIIVPYPDDGRFQSAIRGNSDARLSNELNASLSIVNTSRGEMLKLDVGDFTPRTDSERFEREFRRLENNTDREIRRVNVTGLAKYSSYNLLVRFDYNRSLDTRNGLTNEPHLESTSAECRGPRESGCAMTGAFLNYTASNSTHMELSVRISGRNSWWNWGWSGNSYSQRFYNSFYDNQNLVGSQKGWITLRGREDQGEGSYRY